MDNVYVVCSSFEPRVLNMLCMNSAIQLGISVKDILLLHISCIEPCKQKEPYNLTFLLDIVFRI